jgi:hypothetical protein
MEDMLISIEKNRVINWTSEVGYTSEIDGTSEVFINAE